jgi:aryl-alcohol dehydrogenase-like predicted oxidoreductase
MTTVIEKAVSDKDLDLSSDPLPARLLGDTGELVPILGLGTAPGGMGLSDGDAIALYHKAIDLGITYLDTAPGYGRAHKQLATVLAERRDEVFLVTKVPADEGDKALELLHEGLKDLGVQQVDLTFVHSIGNRDIDRVLAKDGSMAALHRAKASGLTRFVGFTAHNAPWKSVRMLNETDVDSVMLAMNLADRYTYGFEDRVLPLAVEKNVGVAAMKVYGGALDMKYEKPERSAFAVHGFEDHRTALNYSLGLEGVACAVVGVFSESEMLQNLDWAKTHIPVRDTRALQSQGREVASKLGEHFGPVE